MHRNVSKAITTEHLPKPYKQLVSEKQLFEYSSMFETPVPSTEYLQIAPDNKHHRSAAEPSSLAYSGNETVTLVPVTE